MRMKYYISETKVLIGVIIFLSIGWSIFSSISWLKKKDKILVIRTTSNGSEFVQLDDISNRSNQDVINFIFHFASIFYNFNNINFEKNMEAALPLLERSLAIKKAEEMSKTFEELKNRVVQQAATVKNIEMVGDDLYEVKVTTETIENTEKTNRDLMLILKLGRKNRTGINPYGYIVKEMTTKRRY